MDSPGFSRSPSCVFCRRESISALLSSLLSCAFAETVSGDVSGNVLGSHSYKVNSVSGDKTYPEGTNSAPVVSVSTTSGDVNLG